MVEYNVIEIDYNKKTLNDKNFVDRLKLQSITAIE